MLPPKVLAKNVTSKKKKKSKPFICLKINNNFLQLHRIPASIYTAF